MVTYKITEKIIKVFQKGLYTWASHHPRPMPWKGVKDPYKVWMSEIILQQTRVEQGWAYYEKFIRQFPTVTDLAKAPLEQVLFLWEGLGYYSRARNLHSSSQWITNEKQGLFPDNFADLKQLKGVGDYTAAAIASFAYDLPHAIVDGNVHRVLSRYFGIEQPMQTSSQKLLYQDLANRLLDRKNPAGYNQAILDFGAECCTPKSPACAICPLKSKCIAYQNNAISKYPPAKKTIEKKVRHFHYFILLDNKSRVLIRKREERDIWQGLYEFPMIETNSSRKPDIKQLEKFSINPILNKPVLKQTQVLSHRLVTGYFYLIRFNNKMLNTISIPYSKLSAYPLPRIIAQNRDQIISWIKTFK